MQLEFQPGYRRMSIVLESSEACESERIEKTRSGRFEFPLQDSADVGWPTVLIIDDDAVIRLALSSMLDEECYRIVAVTSADQAYERLHQIDPDLILCDLVMQGMNGAELCRRLKMHATWRYVPVIAVTRIDNPVATAAMLDAGADDVIVKPVSARDLRARVAAGLRTRARYLDLRDRACAYEAGEETP